MKWTSVEPPLLIQRDLTVWLASDHPEAEETREQLARFAELMKSPGHLHLYRITPLTLWNAAATGLNPEVICRFLHASSKLGLPQTVRNEIRTTMEKYGLFRLESDPAGALWLRSPEEELLLQVTSYPSIQRFMEENNRFPGEVRVRASERGRIKQELLKLGYPIIDTAGFLEGEHLPIELREHLTSGARFQLRDYQEQAVRAFARGGFTGGSGVLVLPCGAGKTVVGIGAMANYNCETLVLTPNMTSVRQWIREILDKTTLDESLVGEYSGDRKEVRPITVATYQVLTHRTEKDGPQQHMELFSKRNWGLIIYDEVHLLPAPVFRMTAELQAKRRLGLTATLIREDGCEADVFSLVGPKRFEVPWKQLEEAGWLAKVSCRELRVPFDSSTKEKYLYAGAREKIRVAGENPVKLNELSRILERHKDERVLIIGQYLDQLRMVSDTIGAPMISGQMRQEERERLFQAFREGHVRCLVVSKVANFAVDLPDASVAVQLSGSFGSRQEEAQRLGRILRPKSGANEACFYTLVTKESKEQDFALNRQLFLLEQGYRYDVEELVDADEAVKGDA